MKRDRPKYRQIIDAAVIAIAENGYHQAQVSKIAKQAGVADGTIYLYFKNKEDILISVFREKMGTFIDGAKRAIDDEQTANDKLFKLIEMHYSQLSESPYLAIVTQLELRQSKSELRHEINKVLKSYLDVIDSVIEFGLETGEIDKKFNPQLIRQMIFGTLDESVTTWVMKSQRYQLVEQVEEMHTLLTKGFFK